MAVSTVMLVWAESILWTSVSLFLLGLGWNISYVAATAELVSHATPVERGRLLGFTDLGGGMLAAALALLGGVAYTEIGVAAVAIGATVAVVLPALAILLAPRRPARPRWSLPARAGTKRGASRRPSSFRRESGSGPSRYFTGWSTAQLDTVALTPSDLDVDPITRSRSVQIERLAVEVVDPEPVRGSRNSLRVRSSTARRRRTPRSRRSYPVRVRVFVTAMVETSLLGSVRSEP